MRMRQSLWVGRVDLTMGISSLPEAIHMTRVEGFGEPLDVYID